MRRLGGLGLAVLVGACAGHSSGNPPLTEASAPVQPAAAPTASTAPAEASKAPADVESGSWVDAMRINDWKSAARRIDALSAAERAVAEVRYARARAAVELGDHAKAVKLLDGLEKSLPTLRVEIARYRALSQLEAGPHLEAAKYFAARGDAQSLIRAALAFERAGELAKARAAADRAVRATSAKTKKRGPAVEAEARGARASIAQKQGKPAVAIADLRWIATVAPTAKAARDVDARLAELQPKAPPLTKKQRYERAMSFARDGDVARTEKELELLEKAAGAPVPKAEVLHARAWALYMARTDYLKAADLLAEAARLGTRHKVRDLFYSARARSRGHRDAEAIKQYDDLAKRFPKTSWAERARYLSARLHYIGGAWNKAAKGYAAYQKRYKKRGRHAATARYELAVAWLADGKNAQAAKAFADLAAATDSARKASRFRELEGVALAQAGDDKAAKKRFERVIKDRPLSWAALTASARLAKLGSSSPPVIEPAPSTPEAPKLDVKLPPKAQLLARIGLDTEAEADLRRHEEQIKKAFAPRGDEALCAAYGKLTIAARRYRVGQRAVRWTALSRAPSSATQWTWDCIYPRPYEDAVRGAAKEWELASELVYAVMRQESAFHPTVVSPAKAVGLMQLIPPTARHVAKELSVDYDPLMLTSPVYNIRFGSYYLKKVLDTFGGRVELAAAAYNAGPGAVSRWLESGESLPLDIFVARIPYGETRTYVGRVVGNLARYAFLQGGESAVPRIELELPKGLRAGSNAY